MPRTASPGPSGRVGAADRGAGQSEIRTSTMDALGRLGKDVGARFTICLLLQPRMLFVQVSDFRMAPLLAHL